jgi:hypothetical protein
MAVLSVKADNLHVCDCIELSSPSSLIFSERPAFSGSPISGASVAAMKDQGSHPSRLQRQEKIGLGAVCRLICALGPWSKTA